MPTTLCPNRSKASSRLDPINPATPVITHRRGSRRSVSLDSSYRDTMITLRTLCELGLPYFAWISALVPQHLHAATGKLQTKRQSNINQTDDANFHRAARLDCV